jgi:hypothetical protein
VSAHDARGSLWHRWDPHLHAPGTLLNDQFGGDWEAYLGRIEQSDPRIEALGVTDYFCVETYKEVRRRQAAGRLTDVRFLFPNVELRIDTKTAAIVPSTFISCSLQPTGTTKPRSSGTWAS